MRIKQARWGKAFAWTAWAALGVVFTSACGPASAGVGPSSHPSGSIAAPSGTSSNF